MGATENKAAHHDWALATELAGWTDEALVHLLRTRPDLASPPPRSFTELAARAEAWPSIATALRNIDRGAFHALEAVVVAARMATTGQAAPLDAVAALVGASRDTLTPVLARLEAAALVVRHGDHLHLPPNMSQFSRPAGLGRRARRLLETVPVKDLTAIAGRLRHDGAKAPTGTKPVIVAALAAALADPKVLERALRRAPAGTVELMERINQSSSLVHTSLTLANAKDDSPVGYLLRRGILVSATWGTAEMSMETGLALRGGELFSRFDAEPPPRQPVAVDQAEVDRRGTKAALSLVDDIVVLLNDLDRKPAKWLKAGGIGVRDTKRLTEPMGRSDADGARVIELAGLAGLAGVDRMGTTVLPTAAADDWLAGPPPQRWIQLVESWLEAGSHASFAGSTDSADKVVPPLRAWRRNPAFIEQRRTVLHELAAAAPGEALTAPNIDDRVTWHGLGLWRTGGLDPLEVVEWLLAEATLLGLVADGALTTAGRAVAAGDMAGAAAVLAAAAPPLTTEIVIQADLTAIAPGELDPAVRTELDLLADVESTGAATVYRFTDTSVRRALDAGRSGTEIEAFLQTHAPKGVPQTLTYLVADVARRHGSVRVGAAASYLRSDDAALLAEVCRSKKVAPLGLRLLAPTVAISAAQPPKVLEALRGAGFFPSEEGADGAMVIAIARPQRSATPIHSTARAMERAPQPVDLAAAVERLRAAPPPSRSSARPDRLATAMATIESLFDGLSPFPFGDGDDYEDDDYEDDDYEDDDDVERPTEIARTPEDIRELLEAAYEEEWLVRVSYVNSKGVATQLTVAIYDLSRNQMKVECMQRGVQTLILNRIEWARVLTEAEESQF